jgi:hypothetical protein
MDERRAISRIDINHPVVFTAVSANGAIEAQDVATAKNISMTGMMIETTKSIHSKSVKLRAPLNEYDSINMTAEVVYSIPHSPNKYQTGLKFNGSAQVRNSVFNEFVKLYKKPQAD